MIVSFADRECEALFHGRFAKRLPHDIQRVTQRKLRQLNAALVVADLAVPPGNRLEALRGDRAGQYSIRVNDQWRIVFIWTEAGPAEVQFVDCH